jgi:hypothetical protein
MEYTFTNIYNTEKWGDNNTFEYSGSSGWGGHLDYNISDYIPFLKKFIIDNNIKSVIDLGCGDFRCGKAIYSDLDVLYTGYDVYKKIVFSNLRHSSLPKYFFIHLDFYTYKERIINGDICILKDVLQHWPLTNIYTFLDYLVASKKFKYILICNCGNQDKDNTDIELGEWRPLSCEYFPLKKYNPIKLFTYKAKEVSIIYTGE